MSNENKMDQIKNKLSQLNQIKLKEKASNLLNLFKKFAVVIGLIGMFGFGFFIGARMHELGHLEGFFGKDLKGATVMLSGPCLVDGEIRFPSLAEDEVKVTSVENKTLIGVIRKTREVVSCDLSKVAIDKLPLLNNIGKTPVAIPEIKEQEHRVKNTSPYKLLENKVLLISGSCRNQLDGKELAPFTDEKVDVTSVDSSKENQEVFLISGIRKSDKVALVCSSKAVKYSIVDGTEITPQPVKIPLSYINKVLVITSKCIPDSRLPISRGSDGRKIAFFRLVNSPVQILEEVIKDDKLIKLTGTIVDKKIPEAFGQMVVCDSSVFPMTYNLLNEDEMELDRVDSQKNKKDLQTGSKINLEEPEVVIKKTTNNKVNQTVPKVVEKEIKNEPETVEQQAPKEENNKEFLLKQLDEGENNGQK